MKTIFSEKFIPRILIGLATLLLLTIIVSDASPIRNGDTSVIRNGTTPTTNKATPPTNDTTSPTNETTPTTNKTNKTAPTTNKTTPPTDKNAAPTNGTTSGTPPTPASAGDVEQFKLWAKFASAAYCNVTGWDCGVACSGETAGTRLVKFFTNDGPRDNSGYVAINDKEKAIVVGYRGTSDVQSFLSDAQFFQAPFDNPKFPNAKVHSGFLATYNETRSNITNLIKSLVKQNPDYSVISTGHSLGGSLAVFQTLDLIGTPGLTPDNLITYTYGQPRTGNQDFASLVQSTGFKFFRVVNKNDLVPHVPPQAFQYDHYGPEFWINPDSNVVECSTAEDSNCSNSQVPKLSILSHANYFDTLFLLTCLAK